MKKFKLYAALLYAAMLMFSACGGGGGGSDDPGNPGGPDNPATAFEEIDDNTYTYTLPDGTVFRLMLTPDISTAKTFPTGMDDSGSANVPARFIMGETEVTYQLWKEVYDWATDADRGSEKYTFANTGMMGDGNGDTNQHPVTTVNWRDCIVWCNALTEYYNANNGNAVDLLCVYTYSNTIIRDSRDSNATACDNAVHSPTAKGFRLPTGIEWEYAARYRGSNSTNTVSGYSNPYYTQGSSASGAIADYENETETSAVAVYGVSSTAAVKTKGATGANALGLYDMSGNVHEWCFGFCPGSPDSYRVWRSGCYVSSAYDIQLGTSHGSYLFAEFDYMGFRLCRTK